MDILQSIKWWFDQAVPEPTDKNKVTQLGVHVEEFAEMLVSLDLEHSITHIEVDQLARFYKEASEKSVIGVLENVNRNDLADSLADQIVTAIGVAHMFGIDIEGALKEVNRSNYSKFVDGKPIFDENGKIKKPDTYSPPDLTPFI